MTLKKPMRFNLEYTTLKVTIEAKTLESTCDSLEICGLIIEHCHKKNWGRPKTNIENCEIPFKLKTN